MIEYVSGDLFQLAPEGAFLLHACNCKGAWGAGIARQFLFKYPEDYKQYSRFCQVTENKEGEILITKNKIICLMVSNWYGKMTSPSPAILDNTKKALDKLLTALPQNAIIYSPKINSGLFRVTWGKTEALINDFLKQRPDIKWVVVEWTGQHTSTFTPKVKPT